MSYVELKHRLADLALDAVRDPAKAAWIAAAAACAEAVSPEQSQIPWRDGLQRARMLAAPFGWKSTKRDITRLARARLISVRGEFLILPPRFIPHLEYFRRQTARLLKALADLQGSPRARSPAEETVRVAAVLFNAGLFFECHEWGEGLWKTSTDEAREFYHALVQIAAAFYHDEKQNLHGSRTLLRKAMKRLEPYPDAYLGVDVARLRADLTPWAAHFAGGPRPADVPHIHAHAAKLEGAPRG